MKAVLTILQPGENGRVSMVDFDGDLDRLLQPFFYGHGFEHVYARKGDAICDMYVIRDGHEGAKWLPLNEEATRLFRLTLPFDDARMVITGPAVVVEAIEWA